jgi:hypothetical protein
MSERFCIKVGRFTASVLNAATADNLRTNLMQLVIKRKHAFPATLDHLRCVERCLFWAWFNSGLRSRSSPERGKLAMIGETRVLANCDYGTPICQTLNQALFCNYSRQSRGCVFKSSGSYREVTFHVRSVSGSHHQIH